MIKPNFRKTSSPTEDGAFALFLSLFSVVMWMSRDDVLAGYTGLGYISSFISGFWIALIFAPASKGLFLWARSTGLARFPRSHLATHSFVKFSMCSYEKLGWPGYRDLGNRDENFPIWTLQTGWPGRKFLDKIASLSQHSGQNSIIFVLDVFPF